MNKTKPIRVSSHCLRLHMEFSSLAVFSPHTPHTHHAFTGSHDCQQALKSAVWPKMVLSFWSPACTSQVLGLQLYASPMGLLWIKPGVHQHEVGGTHSSAGVHPCPPLILKFLYWEKDRPRSPVFNTPDVR